MLLALVSFHTALQSSSVRELPITEEDESPESYSSSHEMSPDPVSHDQRMSVVRRKILPAPISDLADFSLWSLLRKNIGKILFSIIATISL